jgi:hypothetical protein
MNVKRSLPASGEKSYIVLRKIFASKRERERGTGKKMKKD